MNLKPDYKEDVPIRPAATVMVLREHDTFGLQVLLLKRNHKLKFAPDVWVFPGGRIDPIDGSIEREHLETTAKIAAVREAQEETGVTLVTDQLQPSYQWTTPRGSNRRFATWFFFTLLKDASTEIIIDQSEIVDFVWLTPNEAIKKMKEENFSLLPPTYISLTRIKSCQNFLDVEREFQRTGVIGVSPRTTFIDGIFYSLYQGDSGFEDTDVQKTESLHRLTFNQKTKRYTFDHSNCTEAPITGGVLFS